MQRRQLLQGVGVAAGLALSSSWQALASTGATRVPDASARDRQLDAQFLNDVLLGSSYLGCGGGLQG